MKLILKKNKLGMTIGYELTGETQEEKDVVNSIRNMHFFGSDDTMIVYNGRTGGNNSENDCGTLHWIQKQYQT